MKLAQAKAQRLKVTVLDAQKKPVEGLSVTIKGKSEFNDGKGNYFAFGERFETNAEGIVDVDLGPRRPRVPLDVSVTDLRELYTPDIGIHSKYLEPQVQKLESFPAEMTFYVFKPEDIRDRKISSGVVLTFGLAAGAGCLLGATKTKTETAVVCAIGAVLTGLGIWGLTKS